MFALGCGPAASAVLARLSPAMPRLNALSLSNTTVGESVVQGGAIGTVLGTSQGATLSLIDSAGGRFALVAGAIERGPVALDYEASQSHTITLRETRPGTANSPRDTVLTITVANVFEQPDLGPLTLPTATLAVGQAVTIAVAGATPGSVISGTVPPGLAINSAARTISGTPTTPQTAFAWSLVETLADSSNSPRRTSGLPARRAMTQRGRMGGLNGLPN